MFSSEYDRQLAPTKAMAAAYLDPNLAHALNQGVKTRFSAGMERTAGALERVLRVFHYFESSSEPCTWASNIRHGDSTDVRVSLQISSVTVLMFSKDIEYHIGSYRLQKREMHCHYSYVFLANTKADIRFIYFDLLCLYGRYQYFLL